MPTAPMWIGARLAAVGIAEGLGASMTPVYRGAADMYRAAVGRNNWVRFRFLSVELCRKKPSRIKI
jgi:hypothetical protein